MATMDDLRGELHERVAGLLGKLGVTWEGSGPLPALDRPLLFGLAQAGLAASDDDPGISPAAYGAVDHAELRFLKNFLGRFAEVTARVEGGELRLSDLRTSVEARVRGLEATLGLDVPPLRAGRIALRSGPGATTGGHDGGALCP